MMKKKTNDKASPDGRDPLAHFRKGPFTFESWGDTGSSPKKGEVKMFATLGKGTSPAAASPAAKTQAGPVDHEKEYAEAMKDPEFEKLCKSMGITAKDAVRFHKLMNER